MEPKFKIFYKGDDTYELKKYGAVSFASEFKSLKDEWRAGYTEYTQDKKSFIPCPCCTTSDTSFTFSFSYETGTNTSGGTRETSYEIKCLSCKLYFLFESIDSWGPGG